MYMVSRNWVRFLPWPPLTDQMLVIKLAQYFNKPNKPTTFLRFKSNGLER